MASQPEPGWSIHDQEEAWVKLSEGPNRICNRPKASDEETRAFDDGYVTDIVTYQMGDEDGICLDGVSQDSEQHICEYAG